MFSAGRLSALARTFTRRAICLAGERRGNFAVMAAILCVPLIGAAGLAIDYTNMLSIKARVSDSLDAAAFEAAKLYTQNKPDSVIADQAGKVFAADLGQFVGQSDPTFSYEGVASEDGAKIVKVGAAVKYHPTFMPVLWHMLGEKNQTLSIARTSEVSLATSTVEVALVLDNSGSMAGSKISSLRDAATKLVDRLFASAAVDGVTDPVQMSIVPFAASVNVGTDNADASWMDTTGIAKYHHENFDWTTLNGATKQSDGSWEKNGQKLTRFWLYKQLGIAWKGCVEVRPYPYDDNNTGIDPDNPDTLFVPMFAPDEPDDERRGNNYLDDDVSKRHDSDNERLKNMTKYMERVDGSGSPNRSCTSEPLLPMTADEDLIKEKIDALGANGNTNTAQGAAWGLHTLTPGSPFDGPRDFDTERNIKAMVIMTDGENTYDSSYAAYGYASDDHIYDGTKNAKSAPQAMNQHLLHVCEAAKERKVMVFTIAFDVSDGSSIKTMLRNCASDDTNGGKLYFDVDDNGTDLETAFGAIGSKISALRLYR